MPLLGTMNQAMASDSADHTIAQQEAVCWDRRTISTPISAVSIIGVPKGTRVPGSDLALGVPLALEGTLTADGWLVRSGFLEEESYGADIAEAYTDFLTSLQDRLHSLIRHESTLSQDDRRILDSLRTVLVPADSLLPARS